MYVKGPPKRQYNVYMGGVINVIIGVLRGPINLIFATL